MRTNEPARIHRSSFGEDQGGHLGSFSSDVIHYGRMESEKQWEMDKETQRNKKAKDPKELNPTIN